jgi:hypothetical protein
MSNNLIYICIAVHGAFIPTRRGAVSENAISTIEPPLGLNVTKFTIAVPGTTGVNFSEECKKASLALKTIPNYDPEKMTRKLRKIFEESIDTRNQNSQHFRDQKSSLFGDTASLSPDISGILESGDRIMNKSFQVDENPSMKLYKVKILNGVFAGRNILEFDFLESYGINQKLHLSEDRFTELKNGKNLLIDFSLDELMLILKGLGIINVYIIDPSCNVNDDFLEELRENRNSRSKFARDQRTGTLPENNPEIDHFARGRQDVLVLQRYYPEPKNQRPGLSNSSKLAMTQQPTAQQPMSLSAPERDCKPCDDNSINLDCCFKGVKKIFGYSEPSHSYTTPNLASSARQTSSSSRNFKQHNKTSGGLRNKTKRNRRKNKPKKIKTPRKINPKKIKQED